MEALVLVCCKACSLRNMYSLNWAVMYREEHIDTKVDDHLYVRALAANTGRHKSMVVK
jgi:hypothetical protein